MFTKKHLISLCKSNTSMTTLSVRKMNERDIDLIINYWRQCSEDDFLRMGVDREKFIISSEFKATLQDVV